MAVCAPASMEELEKLIHEAGKKLIVIDFFATWCGPCRFMAPKFVKLSLEYNDVIFVKIDVDEHQEIAAHYQVQVMPTFVFIKEGQKIVAIQGKQEDEIRSTIETNK